MGLIFFFLFLFFHFLVLFDWTMELFGGRLLATVSLRRTQLDVDDGSEVGHYKWVPRDLSFEKILDLGEGERQDVCGGWKMMTGDTDLPFANFFSLLKKIIIIIISKYFNLFLLFISDQ
jgi:hypothetical protein